ncbi:ABC transporter ATP-binding protein [Verticiella sediminum]|uniref:ABC transporter ATP-binding protein n=1 Tax=Verticiella sediminum TaxID=1247510 RepID=A0A556A8E8_9BURK|nr:ABC transporter ATP-binding protein [Verticiella sediminum]
MELRGLTQRYGERVVLDAVDLGLDAGRVLALLGPSGCGKTTLLKLLAGLARPDAGSIRLGGVEVAGAGRFVPPERRGLGMVFQDYALWPHLSVGGNVAFPLQMRGWRKADIAGRVDEVLALVGLAGQAARNPASLSGGQQQRVALARAIAARPALLLFDEPLSNLDRDLRESLCDEIGGLLRELGTTAVYVTHDHEEAFALADQVAVLGEGGIRQLAAPEQLIDAPANAAVAAFLKQGNLLPAHLAAGAMGLAGDTMQPELPFGVPADGAGHLYFPQSALRAVTDGGLSGVVRAQRYRAGHYATTVRLRPPAGGELEVDWLSARRHQPGERVRLALDWTRVRWLPAA